MEVRKTLAKVCVRLGGVEGRGARPGWSSWQAERSSKPRGADRQGPLLSGDKRTAHAAETH